MSRKKLILKTAWVAGVLLLIIIVSFNWGKYLQFDLVFGNDHLPGFSSDKEEAIERRTYVCDVEVIYYQTDLQGFKNLDIKGARGYIEKSWHHGFWHWETNITSDYYSIKIKSETDKNKKRELVIRNNIENNVGFMSLGYRKGAFGGTLSDLPNSNLIRYNILKDDNLNFSSSNIKGMVIVKLLR